MGQVLSEPVTVKHTASGSDERIAFAVSEMQGWRLTMEDAHTHVLDLDNHPPSASAAQAGSDQKKSFFAVYDGHGGSSVAKYAGDTVHSRLKSTDQFKARDYPAALKRTFLATDEDLRSNSDFNGDPSGCTAVAVLVAEDKKIYCANAGDSRSVMSINGNAEPLSFDHKPVNKDENARIVAAGGFVEFGRVNGNLALSRALGDFEFKQNGGLEAEKQVVTADPDVTIHAPTDEDEFVVLACDGIWDVMSSQNTIDFVRRGIADKKSLEQICEELMDHCLAPDSDCSGVGCDNMTVMVLALLHGKSYDDWAQGIATKVRNGTGYETPEIADLPRPFRSGPKSGPLGFGSSLSSAGSGVIGSGRLSHLMPQSALYSSHGGDDEEDDEESEETLLSNLQAALRREGLVPAAAGDDDQDRFESMEVDEEKSDDDSVTPMASKVNGEVAHPAVQMEGLSDKSDDPTKTLAA